MVTVQKAQNVPTIVLKSTKDFFFQISFALRGVIEVSEQKTKT